MGIKKGQKEIEDFFKSKGYTLLDEYKKNNAKMLCEKDGYRYYTSYVGLQSDKSPTLWGMSNIDNIGYNINVYLSKRKSLSKFASYEIIKKNKRTRILVHMICSCGNEFTKTLDDLVYNKYPTCYKCSLVGRGRTHRKSKINKDVLVNSGLKILSDDSCIGDNDLVEVMDSDGYLGFVSPNKIKHKGDGISRFDIRINKKHYVDNVNRWAELQGVDVKCVGFSDKNYGRRIAIKCQCGCGNIFETSITSFQNGKIKCDECSKKTSRYEYVFRDYLDKIGIDYVYQYSLNQCRDTLPLPFDFYLKEYNILIEIDGEGHFSPCCFNHMSYERAKKSYDITVKHDKIKSDFCKDNNIKLIRIPYIMFKDGIWQEYFQNSLKGNDL